jgi:hypothetical protein
MLCRVGDRRSVTGRANAQRRLALTGTEFNLGNRRRFENFICNQPLPVVLEIESVRGMFET